MLHLSLLLACTELPLDEEVAPTEEPPPAAEDSAVPDTDTGEAATPAGPITAFDAVAIEGFDTVLRVSWQQDTDGTTWLSFRDDGGAWLESPPTPTAAGPAEQLILGVTYDADVEYRIVLEQDGERWTTPTQQLRTAPPPPDLPQATILASDPTLWDTTAPYLITSMNAVGDSRYGVWWVFVMDRDGDIVWAQRGEEDWVSRHVSVSHDGTRLLVDRNTAWTLFDGGAASTILELSLDGTVHHTYTTPGLHHPFVPLPDGALAWGARDGRSETIESVDRSGVQTHIWDCESLHGIRPTGGGSNGDGVVTPDNNKNDKENNDTPSYCGSNALWWHAESDHFLFSFWSTETIVEVDRPTGELVRSFGHYEGSWDFSPPGTAFWWQHGATFTDAGTLLVSSKNASGGDETIVREYTLDADKRRLVSIWSFGQGRGIYGAFMGEAHRLPSGNTLHTYGSGGHMAEATADGEVAWEADWGHDQHNGRTTVWSDLYALLPQP